MLNRLINRFRPAKTSLNARKIVTFGDAEAVSGGFVWNVVSIVSLIFLWYLLANHGPESVRHWLSSPDDVLVQFWHLLQDGYRTRGLITTHLWDSVFRVLAGFFFGIVFGVPLGFAMGLSSFGRGFFDPIIELYRPVPPLAWAPLIIVALGIDNDGKIFLLFMAAFSIMVIAGRAGATGVDLSKVQAAYCLGASKLQVLRHVILPNSLPEIFTGMRVAMGVCWGTVVAAEMIAGTTGLGFMVNAARKFLQFDVIWVGIILMGMIGFALDLLMRYCIKVLIPWRGKG